MNFIKCGASFAFVIISTYAYGQVDNNENNNKRKVGFGINPIVTLSSQPNTVFGRNKYFELGAIVTGTIDFNDKNTWSYGLGFGSTRETQDFGFGFNKYITNALIIQSSYFRKFLFIDDIGINFAFGATGIYQNGRDKYSGTVLVPETTNFQSLTLAPALRFEWMLAQYVSLHTQLGLGISLTTSDINNMFDYANVTLKPIQRNGFLGQTGLTVFL